MGDDFFKKMRLIPAEEFDRLKMKDVRDYDPELMNRVRSEQYIEQILSNTTLTPEQKVRLLQANLYTHKSQTSIPAANLLHHIADNAVPNQIPPAAQLNPQIQAPEVADEGEDDEIPIGNQNNLMKAVNYLPEATRKKATKMARFLVDNSETVSVNNKNELVLDNKTIKNSNMTDILNYLFNPRKGVREPHGLKAFSLSLKEINMPISFISNRKVKSFIDPLHSSSQRGFFPLAHSDSSKALVSPIKSESYTSVKSNQSGKGKRRKIIGYAKFPFHNYIKSKSLKKFSSKPSFKSLGLYKI